MGHFHKSRRGSRQRAILSVDQTQFSLELEVFDWDQSKTSRFNVVLRKTGADHRSSETCGNELLDQRDAAKFHRNTQVVTEGIENAFQNLPCRSSFGKDERDFCDFRERNHFLACEWMTRLNDQLQFIAEHAHHTQRAALYRQRYDSDVDGSSLDLLDDLAAEVSVHTDPDGWILGVKAFEDLWQNVEERRFVGTNGQHATSLLRGVRQRVPRLVV